MMLWPRAAVLCIVLLATSQVSSAHAVAMTARDAATANPYNLGPLKTKYVLRPCTLPSWFVDV